VAHATGKNPRVAGIKDDAEPETTPETTMPAGGGGSGRHRYDQIGLGGGVTDMKPENAGGGCIGPAIRNFN